MSSKPSSEIISLRAYGRLRGCSHEAVRRAIASGRLCDAVVRHPATNRVRGVVVEVADREWAEATDPTKPRGVEPQPKPPAAPSATPNLPGIQPDPPPTSANPLADRATLEARKIGAKANAAKALFASRLLELEYQEKAGELVEVATVRERYFDLARQVRDLVLAVPPRLSAVLAAESSAVVVRELLDNELRQVLEGLADELRRSEGTA